MKAKIILITGTSSGFGRQTVSLLLERGHTVIAGMRGGTSRLETLFADDLKSHPSRLYSADLHMDRPETFENAKTLIRDKFDGRLDALINNAGTGLFGALEDQTPTQLKYQFDVNFMGPTLLTQALLPSLRKARGRIINIASTAGLMTLPFYGSYCASKYAVEAMTESLHYELKPHGVQVCVVEPGGFRTDFFSQRAKLYGDGSHSASSPYHLRTQALDRFFEATVPKLADPIIVARRLVKLCEKNRIPVHCPIGVDAYGGVLLRRFFPDRLRIFITELGFRKLIFKE